MAIFYTQILNRNTSKILADSGSSDYINKDESILKELKQITSTVPGDNAKIYNFKSKNKKHTFYFKNYGSLILSAVSDGKTAERILSRFLDEIARLYKEKYGNEDTPHYDFECTIKKNMSTTNKRADLLEGAEQLEDAHNILVENLDTLINRGENINNLKDMADKVNFESKEMSRKVSKMKFDAKMEQYKIYGVVIATILVLLYFFFR
jgi:Synaptobrevin